MRWRRTPPRASHSPAIILSRLNTLLHHADCETTATAVVATYRPGTGRLVWARAGHPPLLLADGHRVVRLPNPQGPLLGMFPAPQFAQESRKLPPGHLVLLYTIMAASSLRDLTPTLG